MTRWTGKFDLEDRVADFAANAISVCEALPQKSCALHIRDQLFRSATSVAANYAEASVPESRKDFAHKMAIALKELVESRMWLRIVATTKYAPDELVLPVFSEADELVRIFNSSVSTARKALAETKEGART